MPLSIVRNDLSRMSADCIVVAANTDLRITGGVGYQVALRAGLDELQMACDRKAPVKTGEVAVTGAFGFPTRAIVHAVGPVWQGGGKGEDILLARAYANALESARAQGARSVAMPLISTGTYGFPVRWAFDIAVREIRRHLEDNPDLDVTLVLWGEDAFAAGKERFPELGAFIDDAYVGAREGARNRGGTRFGNLGYCGSVPSFEEVALPQMATEADENLSASPTPAPDASEQFAGAPLGGRAPLPTARPEYSQLAPAPMQAQPMMAPSAPSRSDAARGQKRGPISLDFHPIQSLQDMLKKLDKPFSRTLLDLIDESGLTDAQVYKRANMSRQHFSKIRNDDSYRPTKRTILALAVALELPLDKTEDLLSRAGFALSHAEMFDVIVEYFIAGGHYDIFEINEALYAYDQPLLGR